MTQHTQSSHKLTTHTHHIHSPHTLTTQTHQTHSWLNTHNLHTNSPHTLTLTLTSHTHHALNTHLPYTYIQYSPHAPSHTHTLATQSHTHLPHALHTTTHHTYTHLPNSPTYHPLTKLTNSPYNCKLTTHTNSPHTLTHQTHSTQPITTYTLTHHTHTKSSHTLIYSRGSVEFFLIGPNRSSNQWSGMILEVHFQNFGTRSHMLHRCTYVKVFIFKKFQGAQILIFFCENWQGASFYIKEQSQKYKFEIWILNPRKVHFWFMKKTPPKYVFLLFRLWFSFKNNWSTKGILEFEIKTITNFLHIFLLF